MIFLVSFVDRRIGSNRVLSGFWISNTRHNIDVDYDLHSLSHGAFPTIEEVPKNWTDMLNYWVTDNQKIQIENSIISSGIIHYSDETFLTDEVMDVFRTKLTTRLQTR